VAFTCFIEVTANVCCMSDGALIEPVWLIEPLEFAAPPVVPVICTV